MTMRGVGAEAETDGVADAAADAEADIVYYHDHTKL